MSCADSRGADSSSARVTSAWLRSTAASARAQIVGHFGDLESRQQLALRHAVADIDVDLLDIAGDLGHHVDFLVRLELGRQHQVMRKVLRATLATATVGVSSGLALPA